MSVFPSHKYCRCWALIFISHCYHGTQESLFKGYHREQHHGGSWEYTSLLASILRHLIVCRKGIRCHMAEGEWNFLIKNLQSISGRSAGVCERPKVMVTQGCMQYPAFPCADVISWILSHMDPEAMTLGSTSGRKLASFLAANSHVPFSWAVITHGFIHLCQNQSL